MADEAPNKKGLLKLGAGTPADRLREAISNDVYRAFDHAVSALAEAPLTDAELSRYDFISDHDARAGFPSPARRSRRRWPTACRRPNCRRRLSLIEARSEAP